MGDEKRVSGDMRRQKGIYDTRDVERLSSPSSRKNLNTPVPIGNVREL